MEWVSGGVVMLVLGADRAHEGYAWRRKWADWGARSKRVEEKQEKRFSEEVEIEVKNNNRDMFKYDEEI